MQTTKLYSSVIPTPEKMHQFGGQLADCVTEGIIIYLVGPLGAGKTTLTRGFLAALGHQGKVKSPTYMLVEPYCYQEWKVFHFDLYRIDSPLELLQFDLADYFTPQAICLIEWPEKGKGYLPPPDLTCYIKLIADERLVELQANTSLGINMLERIKCQS